MLAADVEAALDAFAPSPELFVPLSKAIGAPPTEAGDAVGGALYMNRASFKAAVRRRARSAPDACLDAIFDAWLCGVEVLDARRGASLRRRWAGGSGCAPQAAVEGALARWRRADGWDLSAVDRDVLLGKATVVAGFAGLLVIDLVALFGVGFAGQALLASY